VIERQTIDGRKATVAYLKGASFAPADADDYDLAKVIFDDGQVVFLVPSEDDEDEEDDDAFDAAVNAAFDIDWNDAAEDAEFDPKEHPHAPEGGTGEYKGGMFVPKGEGGAGAAAPEEAPPEPAEEPEPVAKKGRAKKVKPRPPPRFVAGRGTETYVSPNIEAGVDLPEAQHGLQGVRQRMLFRVSGQIDRALGIKNVSTTDVVGAWEDGAEPSLMVVSETADPRLERAAVAMKGHLAGQKAVLWFRPREDGEGAMATFSVKGSLRQVHADLLKAGVPFHTLEQAADRSGWRVHVFLDNQEHLDALTDAAKQLGSRVRFVKGHGEFIGTNIEGTDEEQRADARRVYEQVIEEAASVPGGLGGRDIRGAWKDANDHWRAAAERENVKPDAQSGVTPQPPPGAAPPPGPKLTPLKGSAAGSHPATISSRLVTAVGADPDVYERVDVAAMKATPVRKRKGEEVNLYKANAGLLREARDYPNLRPSETAADKTDDEVVRSLIDHIKSNLKFFYHAAPAALRQHGHQWYEGAHDIARTQAARYGLPLQSVVGVYASQSPQKFWDMNVYLGDRILDIYHTKQDHKWDDEMEDTANVIWHKPADPARDAKLQIEINAIRGKKLSECRTTREKAQWIRTYDQAHSNMMFQAVAADGTRGDPWRWPPEEGQEEGDLGVATWQSTSQVEQAIKCIESGGDRNKISKYMGEQHKVRCFYNNILDPYSGNGDNTVDTHAAGVALLRALGASAIPVMHTLATTPSDAAKGREMGFVPAKGSSVSGIQGNYAIFSDAYREAAADLKIEPRTLQSIVWEAKRLLFGLRPPTALVTDVEKAWRDYHDGKANLSDTQNKVIEAGRKYNPKGGFFDA
jgi:hypothetical protein